MKTSLAVTPAPLQRVPFLFAGDAIRGIRRAAELGYDAVELHVRDPQPAEMAPLLAEVAARGLAVSSLGTGQGFTVDGLAISSTDATVRDRALERLRTHVAAARELGAVVIIGSMQGRLDADPATRQAQIGWATALLRRLGDEAAAAGVRVALEPLNRYETNFNNTAADVLALLDSVGSPALGVLLDTFHMNIEEPSMPDAIERAGARLALVHWSDSNRAAAGMGHTDFRPLLAALRRIGYTGYLSAEILPTGGDEFAAETSLRTMRALLAPFEGKRP